MLNKGECGNMTSAAYRRRCRCWKRSDESSCDNRGEDAPGRCHRRCSGVEKTREASRRSRAAVENARQRKAPTDPLLSCRARRDDGGGTGWCREIESVGVVATSG